VLIDGKQLYVNVNVLRMPIQSLLKLCGEIPELLRTASASLKSITSRADESRCTKSLQVSQHSTLSLVVGDKGLRFLPDIALKPSELTVNVSINDDELYIRSCGWRLFHKSPTAFAFYSYRTPVILHQESYTIPIPPDVTHALLAVNDEVVFEVLVD
jgi:hypothetical protein